MSKSIIATEKAPAAIGPYVQATKLGDLVFTSGQIPLIPETMQLVTGDIKVQAEQSLRNLKAILVAAGASTDTVIKTTCFLKDMNDFAAFNEVYATFFTNNAPARSCVEVARLPKDVLVEVEAIAYVAK